MKVLMLGRPGLFSAFGGDRVQIEQTAGELKKLGVEVDIKTGMDFNAQGYDLVHVFQLDWNPICYKQIKIAKEIGKQVVFSPIHHNVAEVKRFDDLYRFDIRRITGFLFTDQFVRDWFKDLYRAFLNPRILFYTLYCGLVSLKKIYARCLTLSDIILVQTTKEALDLEKTFGVKNKWIVVKNGVSESFRSFKNINKSSLCGYDNYILSVGRIEPRKNQLNLIKAVELLRKDTGKDIKLVLIGAKGRYKHFEYFKIFDSVLKKRPWIQHIAHVPYEKMPEYYTHAKVAVQASWFETTGLTCLEALFCGTNTVSSGDRAREYLGEYATYCDPADPKSIADAIKTEYFKPRPQISDGFKEEYTWKSAAQATLEVYKNLLDNK